MKKRAKVRADRPFETNQEIVIRIMQFSRFGALAEVFVIDALTKHAARVAAANPDDCGNALVSGDAWVGVAKEIHAALAAKYKPEGT